MKNSFFFTSEDKECYFALTPKNTFQIRCEKKLFFITSHCIFKEANLQRKED